MPLTVELQLEAQTFPFLPNFRALDFLRFCTAWFCMDLACFVSCFSAAFSSRLASVLRCMSVRTSMLLPFPPFSFRAPFPPFRVLLGCPFRLASGLPPVRHRPGLGEWCTVRFGRSLSCKFQLPYPLRLPCVSLVPCQASMFQVPHRSGLSPS